MQIELQVDDLCLQRVCKQSNSFVERFQSIRSSLSFLLSFCSESGRMSKIQTTPKHANVSFSSSLAFPIQKAVTKEGQHFSFIMVCFHP